MTTASNFEEAIDSSLNYCAVTPCFKKATLIEYDFSEDITNYKKPPIAPKN